MKALPSAPEVEGRDRAAVQRSGDRSAFNRYIRRRVAEAGMGELLMRRFPDRAVLSGLLLAPITLAGCGGEPEGSALGGNALVPAGLEAAILAPEQPASAVRDSGSGNDAAAEAATADSVSGTHLSKSTKRTRNTTAADLQTSWNDTRPVAATLTLAAPASDRAGVLKSALQRLQTATPGAARSAALPKVPMESIAVLGERGGIAYGAWKGGPAGTLPVTFYFGPHQTSSGAGFVDRKGGVSEEFMTVLRRSAKIWTKRLGGDGKRRDVAIKIVENNKYKTVDQLRDVEGFVLQVRVNDYGKVSGGPISYDRAPEGSKFAPYYGTISISSHVHDNLHDGMADSISHEIGHALGIHPYGITTVFSKYYDPVAHTWSGPNAMRANGGKPVPLQWVDGRKWWEVVEPHAEGARRDAGHVGVCTSLMAYCHDRYSGGAPSELEFAILADLGRNVLDAKVADETERYGYAAWGSWAAWGVSVERDLRDNFHEAPNDHTPIPHDYIQARADAFGTAPATALSDNADLQGTAVWNGSLLGVDLGRTRRPPVVGDAKLTVDLAAMDGELLFSDLTVHLGGGRKPVVAKPFRQSSLRYAVDISGNSFNDETKRVHGGFFGPQHQEMAGVVQDKRSSVQLLGGFGGVRDAD